MHLDTTAKLNMRYLGLQVPFWMSYSAVMNFASAFLLYRAFDAGQIGIILAVANLIAALLQPPMASFADRMEGISLTQLVMFFFFCDYIVSGELGAASGGQAENQVKGQTLQTTATTAGGVLGNLLGGWLLDRYGVSAMKPLRD